MSFPEPGATTPPAPQPPSHNEPASYGAPTPPAGPKSDRNVLALIALITSIVGFVFACIPGALVVGWVLLPIAFILAIVSLFLKGRGKALGIAGLIVSVVGTIVAIVVFFAVVASSFSNAFDDEVSIETPTSVAPATDEPSAAESTDADEPAGTAGSRENPATLGYAINSDTWTVTVNSYNADGNAAVTEASEFNDAAPPGSHYELVNYTVTYTGDESAYAAEVSVDLVTSAGNVVNSFDTFVMLGDSIGLDELFNGGSATGSAAFVVPDGEVSLVRVSPGYFADDVFVKP